MKFNFNILRKRSLVLSKWILTKNKFRMAQEQRVYRRICLCLFEINFIQNDFQFTTIINLFLSMIICDLSDSSIILS